MKETTFIAAVQKGQVKQPTQLDYTPDKWTRSYQEYKSPSENDERVYTAGLWFNERLSQIRQVLDNYQLAGLTNTKYRRLFVAFANQQYAVIINASGEDAAAHAGQVIPAGHLIDGTLPIGPYGQPVNITAALESMISALKYPLAETFQQNDNSQIALLSDLEILNIIKARLSLASFYAALSDLWAECLWNSWSVVITDEYDVVQPPPTAEYISAELSQYRRDVHLLELSWRALKLWKDFTIAEKQAESGRLRIIDLERRGKKKRLKIGQLTDISKPPHDFLMGIAAEELYWNELLMQPLPNLKPVTIRELLLIWDVLSSLGKVLERRLRKDTGVFTINSLLEFAPKIETAEIVKAVTKASGLSYDRVMNAVKLITFSGSVREDPWFTPLVPISASECCVIIPALTIPNLIRSIEHWMKEGGFDLSTRGNAFETHVRNEITEYSKDSKYFSDMKVNSSSLEINVGAMHEEIDLACYWRKTVIIGEIKCTINPATPIEFYKHYHVLRGAVDQAKRKAAFVRMHLREYLNKLGVTEDVDIASINILPIVLTNLEIGVGVPIDDVPIVDLGILRVYFEGSQPFFAQTSMDQGTKPVFEKEYYSNEAEAEANLVSHLLMPLSFKIYSKLLDKKIEPIMIPAVDGVKPKTYYYTRLFVNDSKLQELIPGIWD